MGEKPNRIKSSADDKQTKHKGAGAMPRQGFCASDILTESSNVQTPAVERLEDASNNLMATLAQLETQLNHVGICPTSLEGKSGQSGKSSSPLSVIDALTRLEGGAAYVSRSMISYVYGEDGREDDDREVGADASSSSVEIGAERTEFGRTVLRVYLAVSRILGDISRQNANLEASLLGTYGQTVEPATSAVALPMPQTVIEMIDSLVTNVQGVIAEMETLTRRIKTCF